MSSIQPAEHKYILDEYRMPVAEPDFLRWGTWFEASCEFPSIRQVALSYPLPGMYVSTAFLGLDHAFGLRDVPILFETMAFGGYLDGYQERYSTWEEAAAGHRVFCQYALWHLFRAMFCSIVLLQEDDDQ